MQRLIKSFSPLCFVLLLASAGATTAKAGDHCYQPVSPVYRNVTVWAHKTVPYQQRVIRYHPCGTPYYAWKTFYKTVKVPVTYRVRQYH